MQVIETQYKPKRGRPPKGESKMVRQIVYIHPTIDEELRREADGRGVPVSEIIREILEERQRSL